MSEKTYLVSIGYQGLVVEDPNLAVKLLECEMVDREYVNGEDIFTPAKSERIEVKTIKKSQLRSMTVEEKENKELANAKNNAEWNQKENERLRKEVEELKCQLKVALTKPTEEV